jgi:hypothetical protein
MNPIKPTEEQKQFAAEIGEKLYWKIEGSVLHPSSIKTMVQQMVAHQLAKHGWTAAKELNDAKNETVNPACDDYSCDGDCGHCASNYPPSEPHQVSEPDPIKGKEYWDKRDALKAIEIQNFPLTST